MSFQDVVDRIKAANGASLTPQGWDIPGSLDLSFLNLTTLKGLNLWRVGGNFYCHYNQLTSLKGAPKEVGGNFYCHNNQLTSLKGAPEKVGGGFFCYNNQLTSLEGAPKEVGGSFYCSCNRLTSLEGAPEEVGGYFSCDNNPVKLHYVPGVKQGSQKQSVLLLKNNDGRSTCFKCGGATKKVPGFSSSYDVCKVCEV